MRMLTSSLVHTIVDERITYQECLPACPVQGTSNSMAEFIDTTPKLMASTSLDVVSNRPT